MTGGDITRSTFVPRRHHSGVRMQQGRVQLDADWNEQIDIQAHRDHAHATDVIGAAGAPKQGGGFQVTLTPDGADLAVSAGRLWVDGTLCELEEPTTYTTQPDLPEPDHATPGGDGTPTLTLDDGTYLVYLDTWQRHVTALEEPAIREVALGGPDTATRTRTVAQVKLLPLGAPGEPVTCDSELAEWDALVAPPGGRMAARTVEEPAPDTPCVLPPGGGFQGIENQLYRVEVHEVGQDGAATFKWSRENASVTVPWLGRSGDQLTVAHPGRDRALGFAGGDWVELTDDTRALRGRPGTLVRLLKAEGELLFADEATATGPLDHDQFPRHPKVIRWDSDGPVPLERDTPIDLERGVRVEFPSGGGYRAGDYWLVPARTAVADVEWPRDAGGEPEALPPAGTRHAYARLAVLRVSGGALQEPQGCRAVFPALTALEATDVAYDNSVANLPDVGTVQEAVDRLSQERDLRHHNRHLHGWGIVCGLEVHCGPNQEGSERRHATVLPGYAIDAGGNDRDLTDPVEVDVTAAVEALEAAGEQVLDDDGDGEVVLRLGTDAELRTIVEVEPFEPAEPSPPAWLAGTLLLDFYNDCVKSLHDWLREQLTAPPGEEGRPAGPASQRLSALTNLVTQAANPKAGRNIFISPREDRLIREFYAGLRAMLRSETFCAMFENARPLPDYPFEQLGMDTIFATGRHHRLRLRPGGREAYSVGPGMDPRGPASVLNRYDLERGVHRFVIDPIAGTQTGETPGGETPGGETGGDTGVGAIQDVAFSPDGRRVFVAVASRSESNTIFRSGTVTSGRIDWDAAVTICGVKLVTLATTAADPAFVYAAGLKKVTVTEDGETVTRWEGAGLFKLNPDSIDPNDLEEVPLANFVPVGPMHVTDDGFAAVAGTPPGQPADSYTHVIGMVLPAAAGPLITLPSQGRTATGDVTVVVPPAGQGRPQAYAVVDAFEPGEGQMLVGFDLQAGEAVAEVPLPGPATGTRLLALGELLLVTLEDRYRALLYDTASARLVDGYVLPLQVAPGSAVRSPRDGRVHVLNRLSNTISVVPAELLDPAFRFPLAELVTYRKATLEAFSDLLGGFLQYLKDCLADHFLAKCPQPTGEEKLYLGAVSIRGRQVYKVCNFSRRRYVKSFPTVGYWLSLVPVLPFLRKVLEEWACAVLPEFFGEITVPAFGEEGELSEDRISVGTLDRLINWVHTTDPLGRLGELRARGRVGASALTMAASGLRRAPAAAAPRHLTTSSLVGQPADQVEERLTARGLTVRRARFDPATVGPAAVAGMFRDPRPGQAVTLYQEDGVVRMFSVGEPSAAAPAVAELRTRVEALTAKLEESDQTITTLRRQLTSVQVSLDQLRRPDE